MKNLKTNLDRLKYVAQEIRKTVENAELTDEISKIEDDDETYTDTVKEGQVLYKLHKVRERDRKIIAAKKKKVLKETGVLKCEACGFDFKETYGELGNGFIECHHLTPLSNFESSKETKLEDLALLCSNCHRMIHKDLSISTITKFRAKFNGLQ